MNNHRVRCKLFEKEGNAYGACQPPAALLTPRVRFLFEYELINAWTRLFLVICRHLHRPDRRSTAKKCTYYWPLAVRAVI